MSGRPYKYGRAMAIAQLMKDYRRPALQEILASKPPYNVPDTVYLHGEDFYRAFEDTIDWVPKLTKVGPNGEVFGSIIKGWPTEEEIAAEIAASEERAKNWGGSLGDNDRDAFNRLKGAK